MIYGINIHLFSFLHKQRKQQQQSWLKGMYFIYFYLSCCSYKQTTIFALAFRPSTTTTPFTELGKNYQATRRIPTRIPKSYLPLSYSSLSATTPTHRPRERYITTISASVNDNTSEYNNGKDKNEMILADGGDIDETTMGTTTGTPPRSRRQQRIRKRVSELAKNYLSPPSFVLLKKANEAMQLPQAVAAVIKDATISAVEMAMDDILYRSGNNNNTSNNRNRKDKTSGGNKNLVLNEKSINQLLDEAFLPMEQSLTDMELSLQKARISLDNAKEQARIAMEQIQNVAISQAAARALAIVVDEQQEKLDQQQAAPTGILATTSSQDVTSTVRTTSLLSTISYEDIDYTSSGMMSPPFLDEDQCLVPGEPIVRVEKAPENSRRIFAGIDIMASVDTVWNVLTDYSNLQNVVPNLVVNEVLDLYNYDNTDMNENSNRIMNNYLTNTTLLALPEEEQCRWLCERMKGSLLRQVGGAKVAGIQFSARTTLEVREWPEGMPDFSHFNEKLYNGKTRTNRVDEYTTVPLERYRFPRPFAISSLPSKDISMQSIYNDDGEFRIYQGVWRMQPLPGCAPPGKQAMRLSYAVQISPRAYLPVKFIEGRIVRDLCNNLIAIRQYVNQI